MNENEIKQLKLVADKLKECALSAETRVNNDGIDNMIKESKRSMRRIRKSGNKVWILDL